MIGAIAGFFALLVAGFAVGRVRTSWTGSRRGAAALGRVKTGIVLAIVAFPVVTIVLAKLFSSDALGWIFGLTLLAGAMLLPCAAIFYVGLRLGSRGVDGRTSRHHASANMLIQVEHGTVHASDNAPSKQVSVAPNTTVRAMVALAIADNYIPSISGGKATWIVESSGAGAGAGADAALLPIAVCAQQWSETEFLIPADISVATHFGATLPRVKLSYRCQDDPDAVMQALTAMGR